MVAGLLAYLVSFTTGEANKVVRNSGTDGLEAWRRLSNDYDPSSVMRRVTILRIHRVAKALRSSAAAWRTGYRRRGSMRSFQMQMGSLARCPDDSLMAALFQLMPSSLEETVMFKSDAFATFDALFDRLSSFATTRHRSDFQERHRFRRSPQEERSRCYGCERLEQGQGQGPGFQQDPNVLQVQQAGSQRCRMSDWFSAEGLGQRQGQLSVG